MKIDTAASSIQFTYPFLFENAEFSRRCGLFDSAIKSGRDNSLQIWDEASFPEEDVLPHVARYLNAEGERTVTARLWKLSETALNSPNGLGGREHWWLSFGNGEISFSIASVNLALFCTGVGFVVSTIRLETTSVEDWLNFLYQFRFSSGERDAKIRAERQISKLESVPFFPSIAGGPSLYKDGVAIFGDILQGLLSTAAEPEDQEKWWSDIFIPGRMLPFATLYCDETVAADRPQLLFRARRFFHAKQEIHPSSYDLCNDHPSLYPYAEDQWFTFSLDGGAFVAFDAPRTAFFRQQMPYHLHDQYFLLFLIALHQRFALMNLSNAVAEKWTSSDANGNNQNQREEEFRQIRDALLNFSARGYFTQVMQRENHHRCYQQWQQTFQVARLYEEVSGEIREIHDFLLMQKTERLQMLAEREERVEKEREEAAQQRADALQARISALGILIGIPALVIGFLGINLKGITSVDGLRWWTAAVAGTCGFLLGLLTLWRLRK